MQLVEAATVFLEHVADLRVDELVSDLLVLTQDDQVVLLGHLSGLFLVCGWLRHRQVVCTHWEEQVFEVLVLVHDGLLARLLGQEELDWVGRWAIIVSVFKEDWNVDSQYITGAIQEAETVLGEEAMTLVQIELVEGVEAILAATRVESVLGPRCCFHIDIDSAVIHTHISEVFSNQRQRLLVPKLGNGCIVTLANEENDEADDKEGHETALHHILLREDDWVEGLLLTSHCLDVGLQIIFLTTKTCLACGFASRFRICRSSTVINRCNQIVIIGHGFVRDGDLSKEK